MKNIDEQILKHLMELRLDSQYYPEYPASEYISLKKDYEDVRNVDSGCCKECKGKCCKRCGCHFSPDDFPEISFEYLKKEIEKGYISIDYIPGTILLFECEGIYLLRIRNKNSPIVDLADFRMGQELKPCILLRENGCCLDYEKRPTGGKLLIPSKEFDSDGSGKIIHRCFSKYTMDDCCFEWRYFQKVLVQLKDYFSKYDSSYPCLLG